LYRYSKQKLTAFNSKCKDLFFYDYDFLKAPKVCEARPISGMIKLVFRHIYLLKQLAPIVMATGRRLAKTSPFVGSA